MYNYPAPLRTDQPPPPPPPPHTARQQLRDKNEAPCFTQAGNIEHTDHGSQLGSGTWSLRVIKNGKKAYLVHGQRLKAMQMSFDKMNN